MDKEKKNFSILASDLFDKGKKKKKEQKEVDKGQGMLTFHDLTKEKVTNTLSN